MQPKPPVWYKESKENLFLLLLFVITISFAVYISIPVLIAVKNIHLLTN